MHFTKCADAVLYEAKEYILPANVRQLLNKSFYRHRSNAILRTETGIQFTSDQLKSSLAFYLSYICFPVLAISWANPSWNAKPKHLLISILFFASKMKEWNMCSDVKLQPYKTRQNSYSTCSRQWEKINALSNVYTKLALIELDCLHRIHCRYSLETKRTSWFGTPG